MAKRSKVQLLSPEDKSWLDNALLSGAFSNYEALAEALSARGIEISKSSLHRYGQNFSERLASVKQVTELSKAVVESLPDEAGQVNEALIRLVQERMMHVIVDLDVKKAGKVNWAYMAKAIAELGRASVTQKKFAEEVRKKTEAAAEAAVKQAKAGGLSPEAAEAIRRQILGIVA